MHLLLKYHLSINVSIAVLLNLNQRYHRHLDGKSIKEVILSESAPSPHETFYWHLGGGRNPEWAVRDGDWKLLGNPEDRSNKAPITKSDQLFLANLSMDSTEMTNLATKYPEVVERLSAMRANYLESIENSLAKGE